MVTALHHAALLGDVDSLMGIIDVGVDANARDKKGRILRKSL